MTIIKSLQLIILTTATTFFSVNFTNIAYSLTDIQNEDIWTDIPNEENEEMRIEDFWYILLLENLFT